MKGRVAHVICCFSALTSAAFSAPAPKESPEIPDYYPTRVGTRLVYDLDDGKNGEMALRIVAVEQKDSEKIVTVEQRGTTRWLPFERMAISERGLRQVEYSGYAIEPWYSLKFPNKTGDKWSFEYSRIGSLTGQKGTTAVLGEEEVTVPAGKFKTVKVERVITAQDGKALDKPLKITVWFAKGIGRVKVVPTEGSKLALKSFIPGGR